jgi:HEPN domain-containing protein
MNNEKNTIGEEQIRKKEIEEWMRYAKEDYNLVQHLYRGDYYPKPLEIICFHCEQATEKQ